MWAERKLVSISIRKLIVKFIVERVVNVAENLLMYVGRRSSSDQFCVEKKTPNFNAFDN